ncbi:putative flavin-containing monooxygenase [Scheffersomyces stipitis CBS 6054]|uniref:Putative flavin-containing monooxygenase n=1 Tax=Scheffersomyces stipitis (strain ATCC 58785 / CBS 6054 / NBRC 10063 / NRRL Y-11545) TaxID=322104 RepID=A3GF87_PICST|nr:putative flavin-containing monooxygenase [Scheffersomyces stipitis CBS 6054]EAZ63308.2 putative flavin-containing monooxygenase [Scheffersomyces stipitis CBS 6054]
MTIELSQLVNPPVVSKPVAEDIPPKYIYGTLNPYPEALKVDSLNELASNWIEKFSENLDFFNEKADKSEAKKSLQTLVASHASWKDHLALSWDFRQFHGIDKIREALEKQAQEFKIKNLKLRDDAPVKVVTIHEGDPPIEWLQVLFTFENEYGVGSGAVRLVSTKDENDQLSLKALSIFTTLENINGHEEAIGARRSRGLNVGIFNERKLWADERKSQLEYGKSKQPTVLIVGGGQGGLTVAARLKVMGIDALIVEKNEKIGDNWRNRYDFLVLHDPVWSKHFPYHKYPESWPEFSPKDKLGDWFEAYAKNLELNYWTNKEVKNSTFNEETGTWKVDIVDRSTGNVVALEPSHIVLATGHSGKPKIPDFKDFNLFQGTVVHAADYKNAGQIEGKDVVVIGGCNSAIDVAHDLYEQKVKSTIIQRSSTLVISLEKGVRTTNEGLYDENGPPVEDADLILHSQPIHLLNLLSQQQFRRITSLEPELNESLEKAGFKTDAGYGATGLYGKYIRRGGGFYIDVGACKLISDGEIGLKQGVEIERFTKDSLVLTDGSEIAASTVILATGYADMRNTASEIVDEKSNSKLNSVWNLDEEGEVKTIWRDSGHPNFWFMGGNFLLARYFSKRLALKIIARIEELDKST